LRGYLMLAERLAQDAPRFATGWNFGPTDDDAKPVAWIADRLVKSWGGSAKWIQDAGHHPREAHFLKLDVSRAKACLDWQPVVHLEATLDWIVEWYRAFQSGADLQRLTRQQIERYEALC
jgi:CDP-glucose 4,6-dehydratase